MKNIVVIFIIAGLLFLPVTISAGEQKKGNGQEKIDKKAADEYFKNAGRAADPSYQDYVETNAKKEAEKVKKQEKKK